MGVYVFRERSKHFRNVLVNYVYHAVGFSADLQSAQYSNRSDTLFCKPPKGSLKMYTRASTRRRLVFLLLSFFYTYDSLFLGNLCFISQLVVMVSRLCAVFASDCIIYNSLFLSFPHLYFLSRSLIFVGSCLPLLCTSMYIYLFRCLCERRCICHLQKTWRKKQRS